MDHPAFDLETFRFFIDETLDSFTAVGSKIASLETDPDPKALLNEIFRPVHSIKGNCGFFELNNLLKISHNLEDLLNDLRSGKIPVDREIIDLLLEGTDILMNTVNRVREDPRATDLTGEERNYIEKIVKRRSREVSSPDLILVLRSLTGKLSELSELDMDPNALPHAGKVLESASFLIEDINGVLKEKRDRKPEPSGSFSLKGKDLTGEIHILLDVLNHLEARKDISSDLAKSFKLSFHKIYNELDPLKREKVHFDRVEPLFEFLDDSFLNSSADFVKQIGQAVKAVIESLGETESPSEVKKIGEILVDKGKISEQDLAEALKKQRPLGQILLEDKKIQENELRDALNDQSSQIIEGLIRKEKPKDLKTIRINQEKIDEFVFGVGGLIMNLDALNFLQKELAEKYFEEKAVKGLKGLLATLNDLAYDLQNKIMEIRRVPARTVLQKLPALVRSLSQKLGKRIDVEILGDEVLVDKDIIEKIEDPLVHMIRNSVDHGIEESTEKRVLKGKPEQGKITIALRTDREFFYLDVMDDGQGIDPEKMKSAASQKGFLGESQLKNLSDQEAINLIFRSGFSSATIVSDLSGRGVGLDVVKTNVEKLGGWVSVDSQIGRGTAFHVKIPLTRTLVTKDALFIEDRGEVFAVQSEEIELVVSLTTDQITNHNGHLLAVIRDRVYPLRRLSDCFALGHGSNKNPNPANGNSRICGLLLKNRRAGLLVEKVLNFSKIVVKDLDQKYLEDTPGLRGHTIRGDGKVAMVLDLRQVLSAA